MPEFFSLRDDRKMRHIARRFYLAWVKARLKVNKKSTLEVLVRDKGISAVTLSFYEYVVSSVWKGPRPISMVLSGIPGMTQTSFGFDPGIWTREDTVNFLQSVILQMKTLDKAWFKDPDAPDVTVSYVVGEKK